MLEIVAYITIKGHKKGFPSNQSFRLINPSKSDIGRINKNIMHKINQRVIQETEVNQWKNTNTIIACFKSLPGKNSLTFVKFDVESFQPSISLNLFQQTIDFAREKVGIIDTDILIILQARKTLLFHEGDPWVQRSKNEDFDGAEVFELVVAFPLNKLSRVVDKGSVGIQRRWVRCL